MSSTGVLVWCRCAHECGSAVDQGCKTQLGRAMRVLQGVCVGFGMVWVTQDMRHMGLRGELWHRACGVVWCSWDRRPASCAWCICLKPA